MVKWHHNYGIKSIKDTCGSSSQKESIQNPKYFVGYHSSREDKEKMVPNPNGKFHITKVSNFSVVDNANLHCITWSLQQNKIHYLGKKKKRNSILRIANNKNLARKRVTLKQPKEQGYFTKEKEQNHLVISVEDPRQDSFLFVQLQTPLDPQTFQLPLQSEHRKGNSIDKYILQRNEELGLP